MWKEETPTVYREAYYTPWVSWLAWYPVKTEQNTWVWFKPVWTRQAYLPLYYRSLPVITQYSTIKRSRWDA